MSSKERVIVAMSGGVDSSVAAARLKDAGFDVVGVTLHLWDYPDDGSVKGRCCAPEDQHDARRVCDALGVPHFSFDRRAMFKELVVDPFVDAYLEGATPSPCVSCNRTVKIRELLPLAERLGASKIATGHYAKVDVEHGVHRLFRAKDATKDQSYFLHMLEPRELARMILPLGDATKEEVRAEAIARDLPGAHKGESQELCFVPTGHYEAFVRARADGRVRPGAIVDSNGAKLGEHSGVHAFTIGQRKGLGVALGRPAFVTSIDASRGEVKLGDERDLLATSATIEGAVWSDDIEFPFEATVKVRARHEGAHASIQREGGRFVARFVEPVRAVSPGQIAVAYRGDRVLGGGTIVASST